MRGVTVVTVVRYKGWATQVREAVHTEEAIEERSAR